MIKDDTQASVSRTEARRRLLRGGFSAAAVIPLAGGAQAAVASNMRCVANQATPVAPAMRLSGSRSSSAAGADGQVRVPLYKSTKTTTGGTTYTRYWMKGSDLILIVGSKLTSVMTGVGSGSYVLSSSNRTSGVAVPDVAGAISSDPQNYINSGWSPLTQDTAGSNRYVSVQFDANGVQVGSSDYKTTATANSALVQTCWSSFSGANRPPTFT